MQNIKFIYLFIVFLIYRVFWRVFYEEERELFSREGVYFISKCLLTTFFDLFLVLKKDWKLF